MAKRPRRTRFTCYFTDGREPAVALGYSVFEVADWYRNRKKLPVDRVEPGDFRALPRIPSGAKPFQANVEEAVSFLGIENEVTVTLSNRAQFQRGLCRTAPRHPLLTYRGGKVYGGENVMGYDATWVHQITLAAAMDADEMGQTLWHELAHAMQFERDCPYEGTVRDMMRRWNTLYRDGTAYAVKPYEVEANRYMEHNAELPLCS